MALKGKVKSLAAKAMGIIGDLKETVTYSRVTLGAYDAVTDTRATTTNDTVLGAVITNLSDMEVDYFPSDIVTMKVIIAAIDLPLVPEVTDYVTISGVRWEVKRVKRVPGDSIFIVYVQGA